MRDTTLTYIDRYRYGHGCGHGCRYRYGSFHTHTHIRGVRVCWYIYHSPEVDRVWSIEGTYYGSFKDHIFCILHDACVYIEVTGRGPQLGTPFEAILTSKAVSSSSGPNTGFQTAEEGGPKIGVLHAGSTGTSVVDFSRSGIARATVACLSVPMVNSCNRTPKRPDLRGPRKLKNIQRSPRKWPHIALDLKKASLSVIMFCSGLSRDRSVKMSPHNCANI